MTDTNTNGTSTETKVKVPTKVDEIDTEFFTGSDIVSRALPIIQAIQGLTNPIFNGDWAKTGELPPGYGILVMPMSKTVTKGEGKDAVRGREFEHCVIAACPTLPVIMSYKDKEDKALGADYVANAVLSAMQAKIRNGLSRVEGADKTSAKLPFSVEEFIERAERGAADQGLAAFKQVAPILVKALDKNKIPTNAQVLRQILQSAKFAEALFPNVKQVVWQKVIALGKAEAIKAKQKTDIFDKWSETRDAAANDTTVEDIEFGSEAA